MSPRARYWSTVALVCLALCPGLVLTTSVEPLGEEVARGVGAGAPELVWLQVLGGAALAAGPVVGVELNRRLPRRGLLIALLGICAAGEAVEAAATNLGVLTAAHAVQSLATGCLLVAVLPPLLSEFPAPRVPVSAAFANFALFGAAVLGPSVSGPLAHGQAWRALFAAAALLHLATIPLARAVVPAAGRPPGAGRRVDVRSLLLVAAGPTLAFIGAGQLAQRSFADPLVIGPIAAGLVALAALLVAGVLGREPLLPVRPLLAPVPVMSVIAAVAGGAAFMVLFEVLFEVLRLDASWVLALPPPAAGGALLPDLAGVAAAAALFGLMIRRPGVFVVSFAGMLLLGVDAAWRTAQGGSVTLPAVMGQAALLGAGAGLTVSPGLFLAALSVRREQVAGALAAVQVLRLTAAYVVQPAAQYGLQVGMARRGLSRRGAAAFIQRGVPVPPGTAAVARAALAVAGAHPSEIVLAGTAVIFGAMVAVFLLAGIRPHAPDLEAYVKEGRPAIAGHGRR